MSKTEEELRQDCLKARAIVIATDTALAIASAAKVTASDAAKVAHIKARDTYNAYWNRQADLEREKSNAKNS